MKPRLTVIAAVGVMIFSAVSAMAFPTLPSPRISISGMLTYQGPSIDNGTTSSSTLKTVSFNNTTLINLLNASSTATNYIMDVTGTNQVPPGSFFIWDLSREKLVITNANGFTFYLSGNAPVLGGYDFGFLSIDHNVLIGSFSRNDSTGAGSEIDQTGVEFYFSDGNGTEIDSNGNGTFHWTYGQTGAGQPVSMSFSAAPAGYSATVGGTNGISQNLHLNASGSATIAGFSGPFYQWW